MIELDEAKKAEIIRKAAGEASVAYGLHAADAAERAIDAVLSHLNTPEASDAYLVMARKCAALPSAAHGYASLAAEYRNGELDAELTTAADYLRKRDEMRDERLIEAGHFAKNGSFGSFSQLEMCAFNMGVDHALDAVREEMSR